MRALKILGFTDTDFDGIEELLRQLFILNGGKNNMEGFLGTILLVIILAPLAVVLGLAALLLLFALLPVVVVGWGLALYNVGYHTVGWLLILLGVVGGIFYYGVLPRR